MTLVPRNRPVRNPMVRLGDRMLMAHDPPRYTRQQIGRYAWGLRAKLYACSDVRTAADRAAQRRFVRYMIQCKGEAY